MSCGLTPELVSSWESRKIMMLEVGDDQHISLNPDMIALIQLDDENGSVEILMSSGAKLTIPGSFRLDADPASLHLIRKVRIQPNRSTLKSFGTGTMA